VDRTAPQRLAKFPQKLDLGAALRLLTGGSASASVVADAALLFNDDHVGRCLDFSPIAQRW
jgi:hypothetical protein